MSAGDEQTIQTKIQDEAKKHYKAWTVNVTVCNKSGCPDLLMCINGRFVGLEVKASKGGITTKLQHYRIKEIKAAGGEAAVVTSVEEAMDVLKKIYESNGNPTG